MNCNEYRDNLITFLKGELPGKEAARIREHLNGCSECRSFASFLSSTLGIIQVEKNVEPDPFMITRIQGALQKTPSPGVSRSLKTRLIPAFAFSLFILAGIFGGFGLGRLITPGSSHTSAAQEELVQMVDDLRQEPMEAFLLEL
jgi:anti-sigma factor RsiW